MVPLSCTPDSAYVVYRNLEGRVSSLLKSAPQHVNHADVKCLRQELLRYRRRSEREMNEELYELFSALVQDIDYYCNVC